MSELDYLRNSWNSLCNQLSAKRRQRQQYMQTAAEIGRIYDRMKQDKDIVKVYKSSVESLYKTRYGGFKGFQFDNVYKAELRNLLAEYKAVINAMDANLDNLNNVRRQYENKGYQCDSIIGSLQSAANSVYRQIQNWVN